MTPLAKMLLPSPLHSKQISSWNFSENLGEVTGIFFFNQGPHLLHANGTALANTPSDSTHQCQMHCQFSWHSKFQDHFTQLMVFLLASSPLWFLETTTAFPFSHCLLLLTIPGCSPESLLFSIYSYSLNEPIWHEGFKSHLYNKIFQRWSSRPNLNLELHAQIPNYLSQSLLGCLIDISNLTWPNTTDLITYPHTCSSCSCPSLHMASPSFQLLKSHLSSSFPQVSHKIHQLLLSVLPSKYISSTWLLFTTSTVSTVIQATITSHLLYWHNLSPCCHPYSPMSILTPLVFLHT